MTATQVRQMFQAQDYAADLRRIDQPKAIATTWRRQSTADYRLGWYIAAAGGMLCDCATPGQVAGWQASREADPAMRKVGVRG